MVNYFWSSPTNGREIWTPKASHSRTDDSRDKTYAVKATINNQLKKNKVLEDFREISVVGSLNINFLRKCYITKVV